ncbi:hypothetical protein M5K25_015635 [Dendrobium thyrsiflorum]|uniref:Uncharacterized protein n=1 Tax=Dendrobium thyrsiflorum TaxID=117978 RepID=A0ABD0UXW1_DENTH
MVEKRFLLVKTMEELYSFLGVEISYTCKGITRFVSNNLAADFRFMLVADSRLSRLGAITSYIHLMLDYLCGTVDGGRSQLIDTKFIGDSGQVLSIEGRLGLIDSKVVGNNGQSWLLEKI